MAQLIAELEGLTLDEMLVGAGDPAMEDQLELLLALSSNLVAEQVETLSEAQVLSVTEAALSHVRKYPHLCLAMICNMTVLERHALLFVENAVGENAKVELRRKFVLVLEEFLEYNPQAENVEGLSDAEGADEESFWSEADPFGHMASVLCNIAVITDGRKLLLRQSSGFMPKLALQFRSRNVVRRRGAVGAVRTCLFDSEIHFWMLHEVKILSAVLLPLIAPTPFTESEKKGMDPLLWMQAEDPDKRPDGDKIIVKMLLENLLLLCQKRASREELRKRKVYPIIRNLDLFLEDDEINTVVVDLVDLLIRDEAPDGEIEESL